jgi:hypothetical protein
MRCKTNPIRMCTAASHGLPGDRKFAFLKLRKFILSTPPHASLLLWGSAIVHNASTASSWEASTEVTASAYKIPGMLSQVRPICRLPVSCSSTVLVSSSYKAHNLHRQQPLSGLQRQRRPSRIYVKSTTEKRSYSNPYNFFLIAIKSKVLATSRLAHRITDGMPCFLSLGSLTSLCNCTSCSADAPLRRSCYSSCLCFSSYGR